MAQTAVEWLIEEIKNFDSGRSHYYSKTAIYNHAYRMEKEQIITAMMYTFHQENTLPYGLEYLLKRDRVREDCEDYFNETYTNGL
jgi:ACT domain-containing protein